MLKMEDLTQNERDWLVFLRMIALYRDPAPPLGVCNCWGGVCESRRG